jgi:hypothetical protein
MLPIAQRAIGYGTTSKLNSPIRDVKPPLREAPPILELEEHEKFRDDEGNTWKVSSGFYDDIKNIFTGKYSQPPIAHRVRGHIRTLTEREPTDESRDNAPSYIRRHMSPSDTWVRGYNKGDENSSKQLATRLTKFSSLADFLATAPRA